MTRDEAIRVFQLAASVAEDEDDERAVLAFADWVDADRAGGGRLKTDVGDFRSLRAFAAWIFEASREAREDE